MDEAQQKIVQEFANLLAQTDDAAQRARIIKRAELLGAKAVPEEKFEAPVRTLGEYLDTPIEVPASLVWPTIVVRGEISTTLGRAGKGKTTMNLNRVLKWGCGRPLFDGWTDKDGKEYLSVERPLKTIIVENEGSAGMFHQKMGTMLYNCGEILSEEDRKLIRENVHVWGDGGYSGLKLDNDEGVDKLRAGIEKVKPDILFVEPFRQLWKGEENSATDMAVVIDNIISLATEYGCGVILSHHERKGGAGEDDLMSAGRGSTVLEGAVACMENFQSVKGGDYRELQWSKARYLQPPPPVRLEYDRDTGWYVYVPDTDLERQILEALELNSEGPINKTGFVELLDEKPPRIEKALKQLVADGRVKRLSNQAGNGGGTTGYRYILASADEGENGKQLGF